MSKYNESRRQQLEDLEASRESRRTVQPFGRSVVRSGIGSSDTGLRGASSSTSMRQGNANMQSTVFDQSTHRQHDDERFTIRRRSKSPSRATTASKEDRAALAKLPLKLTDSEKTTLNSARSRVPWWSTQSSSKVPESHRLVTDHVESRKKELEESRAARKRSDDATNTRIQAIPIPRGRALDEFDPAFLKRFESNEADRKSELDNARAKVRHHGNHAPNAVPDAYWLVRAHEESQRQKSWR